MTSFAHFSDSVSLALPDRRCLFFMSAAPCNHRSSSLITTALFILLSQIFRSQIRPPHFSFGKTKELLRACYSS